MKITPKPYELGFAGEETTRKSPISAKPYEIGFAGEETPRRSLPPPPPPLTASSEFLGKQQCESWIGVGVGSSLSTIKMALSVTADENDSRSSATLNEEAASPKPYIRKKITMLTEDVTSPKQFVGKKKLPRAKKLQVKWPPVTPTAGRSSSTAAGRSSSTALEPSPRRSPAKPYELGYEGEENLHEGSASGRTKPRSGSFTTKINLYENLAAKMSSLRGGALPLDIDDSTRSTSDSTSFRYDYEDDSEAPNAADSTSLRDNYEDEGEVQDADDGSSYVEDQNFPEQPVSERFRVSYRIRYNPFIVKDTQGRAGDYTGAEDEEDHAEEVEEQEGGEERKKKHGSCRGFGRPDVWVTPINSKNGQRKWIAKRVWDLEEVDEEEPEYEIEESGLAEGVQELLGVPANEDIWSTSAGKDSRPRMPGRRRSPSFTIKRVVDVDGTLQDSKTFLPMDAVDFVSQLSSDACSCLTWDSTFRSVLENEATSSVPVDEQATAAGGETTVTDSTSSETGEDSASNGLELSSSYDEEEQSHDTTRTKDSGADSEDDSEDCERKDKDSKKKKKKKKSSKKKKSKTVSIKYNPVTPKSITKTFPKRCDSDELTKSGTPTWKKQAKEVDDEESKSEIKLWWQS